MNMNTVGTRSTGETGMSRQMKNGEAARPAAERKKEQSLRNLLLDRMAAEGWENVRQFTLGSKVPFSIETTRRAFVDVEHKNMAPLTLAIILKYLSYKPAEIVEILKTYTDDQDLWPMIDVKSTKLTPAEDALLAAYHVLVSADPGMSDRVADQLDLLAMAASTTVVEHTKQLRMHHKKRG